jgi:hypothetical protein
MAMCTTIDNTIGNDNHIWCKRLLNNGTVYIVYVYEFVYIRVCVETVSRHRTMLFFFLPHLFPFSPGSLCAGFVCL